MLFFRSRKASITTGIVDRSELLKTEAVDRLSPLTNAFDTFISFPSGGEANNDLEKFVEMEIDTTANVHTPQTPEFPDHLSAAQANNNNNNNLGQTRRHTVGPGDVAHEQALANPTVPINFKFGPENGTHLPINLPMLQNQPLNNFTIKNQNLLKPPTFMEASECKSYF